MENKQTSQTGTMGSLTRRQIIWTVVGLIMAMFLSALDQTIVEIAMPRIAMDLEGFSQYTWVTIIYIIVVAVTQPIIGKLIDMYGRRFSSLAV